MPSRLAALYQGGVSQAATLARLVFRIINFVEFSEVSTLLGALGGLGAGDMLGARKEREGWLACHGAGLHSHLGPAEWLSPPFDSTRRLS